jgi:NADH-ubiquinone oxidoreductase chain 4
MLSVCLVVGFFINNILIFYIFFEGSLIPTAMLILGWGVQPERLQAGIYLVLYTVSSSLPLLIRVVTVYLKRGSLFFFFCLNRACGVGVSV